MSTNTPMPEEFLPRNPSWPMPPRVELRLDGPQAQLTMHMSTAHLMTLCSLLAAGSHAMPFELLGDKADENDHKVLALTTSDLLTHVKHLAEEVARYKRNQELAAARATTSIEGNDA